MTRSRLWPSVALILFLSHTACRESVYIPDKEALLDPPLKSMTLRQDTRSMGVRSDARCSVGRSREPRRVWPVRSRCDVGESVSPPRRAQGDSQRLGGHLLRVLA